MKKLISLLSAVAMLALAAVPASAALTYAPDEDGWVVIESAPTDAEVAAYAPTLKVTTTKLETTEDLTAISSAVKKKYNAKLATHDIYKVTYDMANIGTLVNAYDGEYNNAFFGLYDVTVAFNPATLPSGYETYALNYTLPDGSTGAVKLGVDAGTGYLNAAYTAGGVTYDTIFPARTNDEGIVVDAGTFKAEYIVAYPTTTEKVTVPFVKATVTYKTTVGEANSVPATSNITCDDIVLGTVTPDPEPLEDFVIENKRDLVSGWAWDVTINNYDSAATYTATFTAGSETKTNELFFDGAEVAEGGSIAFAALLKTTKAAVELALSK